MKEKQQHQVVAAFKEEVLQMVFNGRPVSKVARSLGIGENLIYKWKSRHQSKETTGQSPALPGYQALHRRVRELETERDILKKPWPFSAGRPKAGVWLYPGERRRLAGAHALCST